MRLPFKDMKCRCARRIRDFDTAPWSPDRKSDANDNSNFKTLDSPVQRGDRLLSLVCCEWLAVGLSRLSATQFFETLTQMEYRLLNLCFLPLGPVCYDQHAGPRHKRAYFAAFSVNRLVVFVCFRMPCADSRSKNSCTAVDQFEGLACLARLELAMELANCNLRLALA